MDVKPEDVAWTKRTIDRLREGGSWAVPRSGLIFVKRSPTHMVLTLRMPHDPEMPFSAAELNDMQETDYRLIKGHLEAAGVTVTREDPPLGREEP